ncbi:IucA/IucC family siderophore biosynthesis protein [Flavobacterium sp. WLB]|uniref:IucA/IucC family protein n=1 Tax=unclassified Flavobacterium TaxID=196869 RepID=UPI0006AB9EA6|nr:MULTISPECIES: IucA/IucC family siderophore biosynthesis protein [unclassified Flavobacterium]KOP37467.1 IucA/IucC family protein [Flavobacterium sp. VMW]OWU92429.1 IucA/IucC family protein [Flavobacterium sp. NLM]PUU69230.1 IucA/IucC family siderophore biosynthesis protein [Flavobacterium sp. WLB]
MKIPTQNIQHLTKENLDKANGILLKKTLSEFAHELLIVPIKNASNLYSISSPDKKVEYTFEANILALNHWSIAVDSIRKTIEGKKSPLRLLEFIIEFKDTLGISESLLPTYLEEITSTLYSTAYKIANEKYTSKDLLELDYQKIEHAMTEGHPCFVANSGKNGFNIDDFATFSPEANAPVKLLWIAGHRSKATFTAIEALDYQKVLQQELSVENIAAFENILKSQDLNIDDYYFFPVHPWQWFNKLALIFAPDIAENHLVCLGYSDDEYSAQQSIRTFFNTSSPEKFYAKTALSVINMGFMRGLSPYYMESTPTITKWVADLVENDAYLQQKGFTLLGEVATIGYRNFLYEPLGRSIPHNKMLATLWRESPIPKLEKGQHIMTMAALLHVDQSGNAFVSELIQKSGISAKAWISHYLDAYLSPLLHCFYEHEMVFMPHGENLILVLENHIPVKAIMKDITEEVMLFNGEIPLPEKVKRIHIDMKEPLKILCIFNDIFQFYFRFLSAILSETKTLSEEDFWSAVADCIHEYQSAHPHLQEQFKKYNLFVPEFDSCCLNRLQLRNNKQMLDLADPIDSLQFVGKLTNPVAVFSKKLDSVSA